MAFAIPHSSGQQIAAWSPAATPRRVWPSMILAVRRGDRDVGEQADDQAGADRRAVDRRHDRLRAVDDVVDEVARLAHHPRAHGVVVDHLLDQLEAAAGGERLARALDERDADRRVAVDRRQTSASSRCSVAADGVEPGGVERDPQHAIGGPVETQRGELGVALHQSSRSSGSSPPGIARR